MALKTEALATSGQCRNWGMPEEKRRGWWEPMKAQQNPREGVNAVPGPESVGQRRGPLVTQEPDDKVILPHTPRGFMSS